MQTLLQAAADRSALRRQVRIPCQVVDELGFTLLADQSIDLSATGMAVRARLPAVVGSPVLVSFRVPGSSLYIDVDAVVSRMVWGRRHGDRCAAMGLRFVGLDAVDRAILCSRLRGLPPPAPQRRVRLDYARTVQAILGEGSRAA